jgi:hypothetical protein
MLSTDLEEDLYSEAVLQSTGEPVLVFGCAGGHLTDEKEEVKSTTTLHSTTLPLLIPVKVFLWRLTVKRLPGFRLRTSDNKNHKPGAFVIRASDHPSFFSDLSKQVRVCVYIYICNVYVCIYLYVCMCVWFCLNWDAMDSQHYLHSHSHPPSHYPPLLGLCGAHA